MFKAILSNLRHTYFRLKKEEDPNVTNVTLFLKTKLTVSSGHSYNTWGVAKSRLGQSRAKT